MKNILSVLFIFLNLAGLVQAQPFSLGFKGGLNIANQNVQLLPQGDTQQTLNGFAGGLFLDINLFDFLSVQPETMFTMKGSGVLTPNIPFLPGYGGSNAPAMIVQSQNLNYLEIPLLVKAKLNLITDLNGSIFVGPAVSFLLNERNTTFYPATDTTPASSSSVDYGKYFPGMDFGVVFGAGIQLQKFLIDIRYEVDLNSTAPNFPFLVNPPPDQNRVLSFMAGYQLF